MHYLKIAYVEKFVVLIKLRCQLVTICWLIFQRITVIYWMKEVHKYWRRQVFHNNNSYYVTFFLKFNNNSHFFKMFHFTLSFRNLITTLNLTPKVNKLDVLLLNLLPSSMYFSVYVLYQIFSYMSSTSLFLNITAGNDEQFPRIWKQGVSLGPNPGNMAILVILYFCEKVKKFVTQFLL